MFRPATALLPVTLLGGAAFATICTIPPEGPAVVPWYEDFEDYDPGIGLHGGCGWKGWDNDPAFDAPATPNEARSGNQSVQIGGSSDLVIEFEDPGPGFYSFSAWQYIPSDFESAGGGPSDGSWFILLNTYQDLGPYDWSMQLQFDSNDNLLKVNDGLGNFVSDVPYDTDRWVKIQTIIDAENDWTQIYYDDDLIAEYEWTGGIFGEGVGALDIAAVDLFAFGSSDLYYDDFALEPIGGCGLGIADDFDFDGLSLGEEHVGGTDSCNPDTDGDTMLDGEDPCPLDPANLCEEPEPCEADLDGSGGVDTIDFLALLAAWGPNPGHPADLDGSGIVDTIDFLALLAAWGDCN